MICVIKIIFYGVNALALYWLIYQLGPIIPSHSLVPPFNIYGLILSTQGAYFLLKTKLAIDEYRLENRVARAESSSNPEPIALTKSLFLLFPWWFDGYLSPFTVVIHPPEETITKQGGIVTRKFASPVICIRIRLFSTFGITLVGADDTHVEITLKKREQRYAALIALLAVHINVKEVTREMILNTLYSNFADPGDSFDKDRKRILKYLNSAILEAGLLPIKHEDLFVNFKNASNEAIWELSSLCEVDTLPLLRHWDKTVQNAKDNGVVLDRAEVRQACTQVRQHYTKGLLTTYLQEDNLERDKVWWWVKESFYTHRNSVVSLLMYAAGLEIAAANKQLSENREAFLQQAANYYEHCMVLLLTGIPDTVKGKQALELCQKIYYQIQNDSLAERAQQRYDRLTKTKDAKAKGKQK